MKIIRPLVERIEAWRAQRAWERILADWNARHFDGDGCSDRWCSILLDSDTAIVSRMAGDDRDFPADLVDDYVEKPLGSLAVYEAEERIWALIATTEGSLLTDAEWAVAQRV